MGGSSTKLEPLTAMSKSFPIQDFMGKWYVIASIPTPFEKGAYNAQEVYKLTDVGSGHDIDVTFTFNKGSFEGKQSTMTQKGWVYNKETNAEWRVSPQVPLPLIGPVTIPYKAPYIIVDLNEERTSTVVGYPDRSYLWIMARKPIIDDAEYERMVKVAEDLKYDRTLIQKVPQQPEAERKTCPP